MTNLHTKEMFDRAYGRRRWEYYKHLVAACIVYGEPGQWLDLGAGLGLFVECARNFGIDCVGVEGSRYAVERAKKRGIALEHQLLEQPLPFDAGSISTVICNQTMEHLHGNTARFVIHESYRVLRPGGVLLVYSPSKFNRAAREEKSHINLYTPKRLKAEVKAAGFTLINAPNSPLPFLGESKAGKALSLLLFRLFPLPFLSASANCIARKT
jgi:SAM-dependent methyltransferase